MRLVLFLIIVIFTSSCSITKKAIITSEPTKEVSNDTKAVDPPETAMPENDSGEINEMVDALDSKDNTVNKTSGLENTENIIPEEPNVEYETAFEYFNHLLWKELLSNNVSKNGKVDYNGFKNEGKKLRVYIDSITVYMPSEKWAKEDKLAYWINTYNALTVDLILRNYPLNSIKDIKDPWDQRLWRFGNKWLNLNDIEHKILRKMDEPRIHFAIVCASESCPKLLNEAFTASNLETQLTEATREFLSDTSKNEITENSIKLSKIFKWFAKDFKQNGSLIDFLNQYSDIKITDNAKKSFKDYNWDLND